MDDYYDLRNLADAFAANGYFQEAADHYQKAIDALPRTRFSPIQQEMLEALLQLRVKRALKNLAEA